MPRGSVGRDRGDWTERRPRVAGQDDEKISRKFMSNTCHSQQKQTGEWKETL